MMQLLGLGVGKLIEVYLFLKNFPFFWKVLRNWQFLKQGLIDTSKILERSANRKSLPSCEDTDKLLDFIDGLLKREIVDFPNVDEASLSEMLRELRTNMKCMIINEEKAKGVIK